MRKIQFDDSWPKRWKECFEYDRQEIYGEYLNPGYCYAYELRQQATLELVQRYVPAGGRVLDVAAAQGNFTLALAEMGYQVTWNDLRADLQRYVELKHERGSVEYAAGNIFEIDFPQAFDAVVMTEIIEHVAHPDEFLKKIVTLLKPFGHVIMTTPNGGYFRNDLPRFSDCRDPGIFERVQFGPNAADHIFLLHEDEVQQLFSQAGLNLLELRLGTNFLTNGHVKTGALLRVLPKQVVFSLERTIGRLPRSILRKIVTSIAAVGRCRE